MAENIILFMTEMFNYILSIATLAMIAETKVVLSQLLSEFVWLIVTAIKRRNRGNLFLLVKND
jgi:hypothetical protein